LGKEYTAKGIENRLNKEIAIQPVQALPESDNSKQKTMPSAPVEPPKWNQGAQTTDSSSSSSPGASRSFDEPVVRPASLPYELQQDNRKKKRRKRMKL
jgi:hypothetical protein